MSSRDAIIGRIKQLNQSSTDLPDLSNLSTPEGEAIEHFIKAAEANHVTIVKCKRAELAEIGKGLNTGNSLSEVEEIACEDKKFDLSDLNTYFINGAFGVGENAAIWVPEDRVSERILPFITEHLIVVLDSSQLVHNMHQAYQKIEQIPGFGVFIAGPSKTADIEQSLVVGAHGPKRMTVLLIH